MESWVGMKHTCYLISLMISLLLSQLATASEQNRCVLTGTLLSDPELAIFSVGKGEQEREFSFLEINVLITNAEQAGKTDHACRLPNDKPYPLAIKLKPTFKFDSYKKGDQIKLIEDRLDNDQGEIFSNVYSLYKDK